MQFACVDHSIPQVKLPVPAGTKCVTLRQNSFTYLSIRSDNKVVLALQYFSFLQFHNVSFLFYNKVTFALSSFSYSLINDACNFSVILYVNRDFERFFVPKFCLLCLDSLVSLISFVQNGTALFN